mgnify:CR=1
MNTFKSFEEYERLLQLDIEKYNKFIQRGDIRDAEGLYVFSISPLFIQYKTALWRGDMANNNHFHYNENSSFSSVIYISMERSLINFKKLH